MPSARPAARATASAVSSPARGRRGEVGRASRRAERRPRVGGAQDRRRAGDRLEAAEPAAVALGAIGLDDDVADLAGTVAVAAEQLAIEDETRADAAPDLDRDEVAWPVLAVEQERRDGRRAAVVGDDRREPYRSCEERRRAAGRSTTRLTAQRIVPSVVDDARRADTDAEDRLVRAGQDLVDQVVDEVEGRVAVGAVEVARRPAADLAAQVERAPPVNVRSPRSRVTTWRASSTSATRVGALPPVRRAAAASAARPSCSSSRDQLADARFGSGR